MFKIAWKNILDAKSIVLVSHVNPDCDTLGSTLALHEELNILGKKVYLYNSTKNLPQRYSFLPNYKKISNKFPDKFDLVVLCDCGSFQRANIKYGDYKILNIDHHKTNSSFGDFNVINAISSSVSMVVLEMFVQNNINFSKNSANCLYAGAVEDTGFFAYGNINEKTFLNAANLVAHGADPIYISKKLKQSVPLSRLRLKQHVMSTFELLNDGKVGVVVILQEDLKRTNAKREDTEDVINIIRDIENIELAIMILEEDDKSFKISLRSDGIKVDVSKIATFFGGGGHSNAAGFETDIKEISEIRSRLINEYERGI